MGTPDFAANVLQRLIDEGHDVVMVVSQPDRPVGRKRELVMTPTKKVACAHGIEVFQPEKIKLDYEQILAVGADLIVTAAYGQIVPKALLDGPRFGCINVHASLLPKYRGGAPIHQAIIDGEAETGVTIMYMDVKMDTGDIITQATVPILDEDDTGSMFEKLSEVGASLLMETLPTIFDGTASSVAQIDEDATYAFNIKREQELIDWRMSARAVFNQVRGLHPWPVAYTVIDDINVKIFKASLLDDSCDDANAGTIVAASVDGIDVVSGDGLVLRITELQIAGRKRVSMRDLLNGSHPFAPGGVLGM